MSFAKTGSSILLTRWKIVALREEGGDPMNYLTKQAVWAPLLGYLLLTTMLLLVANGVAWLFLSDENGLAIVYLRLYLLQGVSGSLCCFAFLRNNKETYRESSIYGILGALLMFVGFLCCIVSRPEILDVLDFLNCGATLVGMGFACVLRSSIYFVRRIAPREFLFLLSALGVVSILLYSIIDGCPQILGIALIFIIPFLAALLFSGVLPKYDVGTEITLGTQNNIDNGESGSFNPDKEISGCSMGLLVLALSYFIQQSYCLDSMSPESIYSSFSVSFILSVLIFSGIFVVVGRKIARPVAIRSFHVAALVSSVIILFLLFSGETNVMLAGAVFAASSLCLVGYAAIFLCLLCRCSNRTGAIALAGAACTLFLFTCLIRSGISLTFLGVHFISFYASVTCSCVTIAVLAALVVMSERTPLFSRELSLFKGFRGSTHKSAVDGRDDDCVLLAREAQLTAREEEILVLLVQGHKNKVIAEKLFVSVNTINVHVRSIYAKTEVHSRLELIKNLIKLASSRRAPIFYPLTRSYKYY